MKLLSLGIDNSILDKNSNVAKRMLWYSEVLDYFCIVVPNDEDREIFLSNKIKVIGVGGKNKIVRLMRMYFLLEKILKKEKFDTMSVQDIYFLAFLAYFLKRKYKIFLQIQVHGLEKFEGIRKMIAKFTIRKADNIRVVSRRLKKKLMHELKVEEKKISLVPIYVDYEIKESEIQNKKNNQEFIFLWLGRFVEQKNLSLLINSFSDLLKKHKNIKLRLIGKGEEKEKIIFLINELKIKERVEILDWTSDVKKEYLCADAYVLSSDYEGWGMVIVESVIYNLPIIMTDVGCAGEFVKNEESALIIPVNDRDKLSEAMERIYQDEKLREKLIKNAREVLKKLPNKKETLDLYFKSRQDN